MRPVQWSGCYDEGWKGLIVPSAFAHPAKMARGLVARIFDELLAIGALKRGDTVCDPFGGIGTTAIEGASRGVQVVCCELEPRFVELARQNFELHRAYWEAAGQPLPIIVQGDSRRLRLNIAAPLAACAIISSPPYADGCARQGHDVHPNRLEGATQSVALVSYGDTPGQLGAMPAGEISAVVSSPPYVSGGHHRDVMGAWNQNGGGYDSDAPSRERFQPGDELGYGRAAGQMGQMAEGSVEAVISSPPYAEIASGAGGLNTKPPKHQGQQGGRSATAASQDTDQRYGESDGQLARLPKGDVEAIVSSPPYAGQGLKGGDQRTALSEPAAVCRESGRGKRTASLGSDGCDNYGNTPGQLGAMRGGEVDAVVSSPPFGFHNGGGGINTAGYRKNGTTGPSDDKVGRRTYQGTGGERSEGNLETLTLGQVDGVVSSPPYERSLHASDDGIDWEQAKRNGNGGGEHQRPGASAGAAYPISDENIGNTAGETFWSAAKQIVAEAYALLKPGGHAVWVVKHFVRDKQLVDFPGDWRKLCEHVGFETVKEVRAMLVHEEVRPHLFDGHVVKRRERKSFFRRLAEKKGSPRIDFETVLFMRKPEG